MGLRDREAGLPVTQDTLFAIGSATKTFTATTVSAVIDEGLQEWDRPLQDYLPGVRLHDPNASDRLTIVDLLSHRSGLPRHEMTWLGQPDRSRAEIVRSLRFLPLSRDLRQEFQYCNLGYLVSWPAGNLRARLGDRPVPGTQDREALRRHRRVPVVLHAAARRQHRRGGADEHVGQRDAPGRLLPGPG